MSLLWGATGYGDAPNGTRLSDGDCNDAASTINPGAVEQWDDGIDSNCDGEDDPLHCAGGECGCEFLATPEIEVHPACAAADLFIAAMQVCQSCLGYNVLPSAITEIHP